MKLGQGRVMDWVFIWVWIKGLWSNNIGCPYGLFEIIHKDRFVTWLKVGDLFWQISNFVQSVQIAKYEKYKVPKI